MVGLRGARPTAPVAAVAGQVLHLLDGAPVTGAYRAALAAALELPGNILSDAPDARWARIVWGCCAAAGGGWGRAVPAAAAVEILMVALDVLDDEEDGEETPLRAGLGSARALNVSTGLLMLAQRGLMGVEGGAAASGVLLDHVLGACAGQHADLDPGPPGSIGLDEALEITAAKSGSLVGAACEIGASCAGTPMPLIELYGGFGRCVGMVAQLANDIAAVRPSATDKTDIALGRPTLPLAYAALYEAPRAGREADAGARASLSAGVPAYLTWAVADTYRRRALSLIPRLATDSRGRAELESLLPALA